LHTGKIVSVKGSVVDVEFPDQLPAIYTLLHTGAENQMAIEVLSQLDARRVRGIALTPTQGLARGMAVSSTGKQLSVPVGKNMGRMFDVFGNTIDNISRFIQAGMEVSGLMGQMPSRQGYQPTMETELSKLEERIANTEAGAITSIQAVYVPADDLTDPAAVHTFSHLSASIVLSRKKASEGLYPAIDLLQSNSKMATPGIIGKRHYELAQEIRKPLAHYEELKDIIAMLGMEQLSAKDHQIVNRARRLERFLTQPFFTTEQFSSIKGKEVSLEEALNGCERILADEFTDLPESAFYLIGNIDDALKKHAATDKSEDKKEPEDVPQEPVLST
jgi:F-type H+-transporting ATPase subunit beta